MASMRNQSLDRVRRASQKTGIRYGVSEPKTSKESIYAWGQPGIRSEQRQDEVTTHVGSWPNVGCHGPKRVRRMSKDRVVGHRGSELRWSAEGILTGKGGNRVGKLM